MPEFNPKNPLNQIKCPSCGSEDLNMSYVASYILNGRVKGLFEYCECLACDNKWENKYKFVSSALHEKE